MPRVLFASSLCFGIVGAVVDCEVQGICAGASVGVRVAVGISTSSGVRLFVP